MYFSKFSTVDQIKAEYRRLAKLHHPDRGGDTAIMQTINAEYQDALARCDGQTSAGSDGKDRTYHYNAEAEAEIVQKIQDLLSLNLPGIEIWLIGTWVWVDGDTRPVKGELKAAGCRWHSKRKKWYWRRGGYRRSYNSGASLEALANKYGASHFKNDEKAAVV